MIDEKRSKNRLSVLRGYFAGFRKDVQETDAQYVEIHELTTEWKEMPGGRSDWIRLIEQIDKASIYGYRAPKGMEFPLHRHHVDEKIVIISGVMEIRLPGENVILNTLDSIKIPAHMKHAAYCHEDVQVLLIYNPPFNNGQWKTE